jgi:hypothetical protein
MRWIVSVAESFTSPKMGSKSEPKSLRDSSGPMENWRRWRARLDPSPGARAATISSNCESRECSGADAASSDVTSRVITKVLPKNVIGQNYLCRTQIQCAPFHEMENGILLLAFVQFISYAGDKALSELGCLGISRR